MEVRDHELREIERERALRRLLHEVGAVCAGAADLERLVRSVLVHVVMGFDAVTGWVGLAAGASVFSSEGGAADDADIVRTVAERAEALRGDAAVHRIGAGVAAVLPGVEPGCTGVYVPLRAEVPRQGWLILIGGPREPLPVEVEGTLPALAAYLGLAVGRTRALTALRRLNRQLEATVSRRTAELEREKQKLEARVRERTLELERAKQATVATERQLLDRERIEGVHQLAAGLAHELNNPLGALKASLEFLRDELARVDAARGIPAEDLEELGAAVHDGLEDARRMAGLVASLFGQVTKSRRAAVRSDLDEAVREAIQHFRLSTPGGWNVGVDLGSDRSVGIAHGELTRWVFRLLCALAGTDPGRIHVRTRGDDSLPVLEVGLKRGAGDVTPDAVSAITNEFDEGRRAHRTRVGQWRCDLAPPLPSGDRRFVDTQSLGGGVVSVALHVTGRFLRSRGTSSPRSVLLVLAGPRHARARHAAAVPLPVLGAGRRVRPHDLRLPLGTQSRLQPARASSGWCSSSTSAS